MRVPQALASVLVVAAMLLFARDASACDCVRLGPVGPGVRAETPFIFSGTVIEIIERNEHTTALRSGGATSTVKPLERRVVFRVTAGWRGVTAREFSVLAEVSDCMFAFELDKTYLVFANANSAGIAESSICTRTTAIERAAAVLKALGPPTYRLP